MNGASTLLVLIFTVSLAAAVQQPGGGATAGQASGWNGVFPPTVPDDTTGFVPIFDGKSLAGWEGDLQFWRVENGEIVGETTPEGGEAEQLPDLARRNGP